MILYNKITNSKVNQEWMDVLFSELDVEKLKNKYKMWREGSIKEWLTKNINKKILLEDYDIFQSIFEVANAGLYKYHSKKQRRNNY